MQRLRAALVDLVAKIAKIATLQAFSELNIALNAEGREQHNKRQNIKWHFGPKDDFRFDPSLIVQLLWMHQKLEEHGEKS